MKWMSDIFIVDPLSICYTYYYCYTYTSDFVLLRILYFLKANYEMKFSAQ